MAISTWLPTSSSPKSARACVAASARCTLAGVVRASVTGRAANAPAAATCTARKSMPSLVMVPVLSKQATRTLPAMAILAGSSVLMPRPCRRRALWICPTTSARFSMGVTAGPGAGGARPHGRERPAGRSRATAQACAPLLIVFTALERRVVKEENDPDSDWKYQDSMKVTMPYRPSMQ